MPFVDYEEWEKQYFEPYNNFKHIIPTSDASAWKQYENHRWVYFKNKICEIQNISWLPSGVLPEKYPVFSKPVFNLYGMGAQAFRMDSKDEYIYMPGHIVTEYFTGDHVSTDLAISRGKIYWLQHAIGHGSNKGAFDYWELLEHTISDILCLLVKFVIVHLKDFTGVINVETIGGRMIDVHLRFSNQWIDLYSENWLDQIQQFYITGKLTKKLTREKGYSVAAFSSDLPDLSGTIDVQLIVEKYGVSSIQIPTYLNAREAISENPDFGIRIAVVNGRNLQDCRNAILEISQQVGVTQNL